MTKVAHNTQFLNLYYILQFTECFDTGLYSLLQPGKIVDASDGENTPF